MTTLPTGISPGGHSQQAVPRQSEAADQWCLRPFFRPVGVAVGNVDNCSVPCEGRGKPQVLRSRSHQQKEWSAEAVIARHKQRKKQVRRITIDLDPTDDPTHGAQQLAFFGRFYDTACYLPLAGFLTFDVEVEQYLLLRPVLRHRRLQARCDRCVEATTAAPAPGVPQGVVAHPAGHWLFRSGVVCVLRGTEARPGGGHGEEHLAEVPGRAIDDRGTEKHWPRSAFRIPRPTSPQPIGGICLLSRVRGEQGLSGKP